MNLRKRNMTARPSWIKNSLLSMSAALVLGYLFLHQRLLTKHMGSRLLAEESTLQRAKFNSKDESTPQIMALKHPAGNTNLPQEYVKEEPSSEKPCDISNRQEFPAEKTTKDIPKQIEWLPPCPESNSTSSFPFWLECDPGPKSIDVVLTVYRRSNLRLQLEMLVNQTLSPQNIFVYQSERFVNVQVIVQEFQSDFGRYKVPIHILQAPVDTAGYHGRFYMAYTMSRARYVSIWDDDVSAGAGWLERVATFLNDHDDRYIVSSGGRMVQSLVDPKDNGKPIVSRNRKDRDSQEFHTFGMLAKRFGEVDFCVHNYNLPRELLRYWIGSPVQTYYTGEDMQLAFVLQQYGVRAYKLGRKGNGDHGWADGAKGLGANNKNKASYKKKRNEPRQWLICKLVLEGFQTIDCSNCNSTVAKRCMDYYESLEISANNKK